MSTRSTDWATSTCDQIVVVHSAVVSSYCLSSWHTMCDSTVSKSMLKTALVLRTEDANGIVINNADDALSFFSLAHICKLQHR